jgi:drug/metabolite transporter (DMT)-like permease
MLLACLAFAVMGTLAHALAGACDWQVIALARTAVALVVAALFARGAGVELVFLRPRALWMRSIAGSMSLVCTFYALTRLPVSHVLTLTNMFPIWVAVLSWPLLNELPGASVWLAVASGVSGVALVQQPHFAAGNLALLLALASSFFSAVAMIGLHRLQRLDVRAIVVHFSAVGLVFCLASFALFEHTHDFATVLSGGTGLMLLGVGLSATAGQIWLTRAFAGGPPAKVAVVGLTQIVFALGFDVVFWGQQFDAATLGGIALIVFPTAWVMWRQTQAAGPASDSPPAAEAPSGGDGVAEAAGHAPAGSGLVRAVSPKSRRSGAGDPREPSARPARSRAPNPGLRG